MLLSSSVSISAFVVEPSTRVSPSTTTVRLVDQALRAHRPPLPVQIRAGQQTLTAEDPLPADLRDALSLINRPARAV